MNVLQQLAIRMVLRNFSLYYGEEIRIEHLDHTGLAVKVTTVRTGRHIITICTAGLERKLVMLIEFLDREKRWYTEDFP